MKRMLIVLLAMGLVFGLSMNAIAGSDADAEAAAVAGAKIHTEDNSINKPKSYQPVNPGVTPLPQTNGFFTSPTPDSSFRSVKELLQFSDTFSRGALEALAKGGKVEVHFQVVNDETVIARGNEDENGMKMLKVVLVENKPENFQMTAPVDGEAKNGKTNSFQVFGKIGLATMNDGNNVLVITKEGAHRKVEASGWGIGFYTVGGMITEGGESALGGGGTGYAENETGTEDRPWIQGYAGMM